jgi:hypothetical protein
VGTVTATSATVTTLNATNSILTGNLTATSANFSKAVTGAPPFSTTLTTIDFSQSNLAFTTASAGNFTLNNMRNGGTYTLAVQGTTSGLLNPSAAGFNFVSLGNYSTVSGMQTVYTFVVMGTTVYFSMVSQQ